MSVLVVVPVITWPRPNIVSSWTHPEHCVVVNGEHDHWHTIAAAHPHWAVVAGHGSTNLGCPASWNRGFDLADELGHSHVLIMSQSMLIHAGTASFIEHLPAADVIDTQHQSFHCVAISVDLWRRAGRFDERLPIYCDVDFGERIQRLQPSWARIDLAATTERCVAVRSGQVDAEVYENDQKRYEARR